MSSFHFSALLYGHSLNTVVTCDFLIQNITKSGSLPKENNGTTDLDYWDWLQTMKFHFLTSILFPSWGEYITNSIQNTSTIIWTRYHMPLTQFLITKHKYIATIFLCNRTCLIPHCPNANRFNGIKTNFFKVYHISHLNLDVVMKKENIR